MRECGPRSRRLVLVCLLIGMGGPTAYAQDPIHKAGRGLANILGCWIELPKQFRVGLTEQNPVVGGSRGFLRGAGLTVARLGVGAYEAVTFLVPIPTAYASPYENLELRDYPWQE
ncbi:MAG: exosortase system-associated protein, TIGR04073 family [Candidatus Omnitrophica bacterium]|nr:exosortase system-associated protein, TIGR04073 family [Candidatus Omnitrophota bacterium]